MQSSPAPRPHPRPLALLALAISGAHAADEVTTLGEVTVTGTREATAVAETPATVNDVSADAIAVSRPQHPKDVLNALPGVWVSNLSGEGHSTAIRQPLTTGAVYLYLEDGIPTRSTGFFNHNALYEINVPQSGGLEVMKGPGSALYGSDAIGGTINVLTRTPPTDGEFEATAEGGSWGWGRVLASGGDARGNDAWRASLNITHSDGWHDSAGYDRQAGTLRWDRAIGDSTLAKTVLSFSHVDQQHVGSVNLTEFARTPERNNIPFSYRVVDALRLSTAIEKEDGDALWSVTPYLRDNSMEIIPSWSVSYDPSWYETGNRSAGVLAKYRRDFAPMRTRLIAGIDVDYSPGSRDEDSISLTRTTNAEGGTTYSLNSAVAPVQIYDYDVTYTGVSPYLHAEFSPLERLRVTAGLRYDNMRYDYDNHFNGGAAAASQGVAGAFPGNGWYGHAASTTVDYTHTGPKLGATWAFSERTNAFLVLANSFRTPSEGQVFRGSRESTAVRAQAAAQSLLDLKPVVVDNVEIGLRTHPGKARVDVSVYQMTKEDDIVSYTDPVTTQRTVVNAGETLHRGLELAVQAPVTTTLAAQLAWSHARHTYEQWVVSGTADYSGKDMESAPRNLANARLAWSPGFLAGGRLQLEYVYLGSFWRDAANTGKYEGHELVNLAANRPLGDQLEIYARVNNLLDEQYAETAGGTGAAPTNAVGLPLSATIGLTAKW
jgi:iron complex outermembrane receptor protein